MGDPPIGRTACVKVDAGKKRCRPIESFDIRSSTYGGRCEGQIRAFLGYIDRQRRGLRIDSVTDGIIEDFGKPRTQSDIVVRVEARIGDVGIAAVSTNSRVTN